MSYSPTAEPGDWEVTPPPHSHSGSWLYNRCSPSPSPLKPLCWYCFPASVCLLTSRRLRFYHFNSWMELYLRSTPLHCRLQWSFRLSPQLIHSSSIAVTLLWNLLLCSCHDSWVLMPLYCFQVWETPCFLGLITEVKDPTVNHVCFPFLSTFTLVPNPGHITQTISPPPSHGAILLKDVTQCCVLQGLWIYAPSPQWGLFTVFLSNIFVILPVSFLLTCSYLLTT